MIYKSAAVKYGWGGTYDPFFGLNRLPEGDPIEKIFPFSVEGQLTLTTAITDHWKPYFRSAFTIGLREGERRSMIAVAASISFAPLTGPECAPAI